MAVEMVEATAAGARVVAARAAAEMAAVGKAED